MQNHVYYTLRTLKIVSGILCGAIWCLPACVCVQLHGCLPACGGGREAEMERREEEGGRVMMLREEKGGKTVCSEVREGRERERERTGKKGKGSSKGRDREDAPTAYRCWSLQQRSAALSGHRKMVSVRGELTVAYNLMFSILDSFSMGNATARNSRAKLASFLLFTPLVFILWLSCSLGFCPSLSTLTFLFQAHTQWHACVAVGKPGSSECWVSPWGWPRSSAAPVKPSVGRGSDADRSRCLPPHPTLSTSSSSTSHGRASKGKEIRREKEMRARWAFLWQCLGFYVIFFLPFIHPLSERGLHTITPLVTISLFSSLCLALQEWHLQRRVQNW